MHIDSAVGMSLFVAVHDNETFLKAILTMQQIDGTVALDWVISQLLVR